MKQLISGDTAALPGYSIEWGQAPSVERAGWLGEGDYCRCYLVNSQYVFRFAKHADASAAMAIERCLLPLLWHHLALAVPQPEFAGRSAATGLGLMGYQVLPGEPLERHVLDHLPATSQAWLIFQIAEFMRQLHALPLSLINHCGVRTLHPSTHLTNVMERARIEVWPHLSDQVRQYHEGLLIAYLGEARLHTYRPALLHGDLSPGHFLADTAQARLTGVIDFGDACIGDPAWDFVYVYEDYGPATLKAVLAHYAPGQVELLAQKTRIYQQLNNVEYCLAVLQSAAPPEIREAIATLEDQAAVGEQ